MGEGVVNATQRPLYPRERHPVPILQEAVWPQCRSGRVRKLSTPPQVDVGSRLACSEFIAADSRSNDTQNVSYYHFTLIGKYREWGFQSQSKTTSRRSMAMLAHRFDSQGYCKSTEWNWICAFHSRKNEVEEEKLDAKYLYSLICRRLFSVFHD